MNSRSSHAVSCPSFLRIALTMVALPFLGACESETGGAEMDEVPEVAEIVSVAGVLEAAGTAGYDQWESGAGVSDELAADVDLVTVYYLDDDAAPDPDA